MAFLSAVFNKQDGTVKASLDESSVMLNGSYTLDVKVEEKRSDGKTSVKTYTITFDVTGIAEAKKDDAKSTGGAINTGIATGKIFNVTAQYLRDPKKVKEMKELDPPTIKIGSFNKYGLMEIEFSESFMAPENITMINSTALEIKVKAANDEF